MKTCSLSALVTFNKDFAHTHFPLDIKLKYVTAVADVGSVHHCFKLN